MFAGLTGWHVIILLLSLAPFVLWIIALVQIATSKATGGTIALWVVIVTLFPLVGAIVWFAVGKRTAAQSTPASLVGPTQAYAEAPTPTGSPAAGWYPSPSHPGLRQWWDGSQWTSHLESAPPAV